jgi:hypothetical protein
MDLEKLLLLTQTRLRLQDQFQKVPIYFKGYLPMKTNIKIIEKIKAAVEKLAGKINIM